MARFAAAQNNFTSGELSPKLKGRQELKESSNGLSTCKNFIPLKTGGVTKKPGTQYIKDITADFNPAYDIEIFEFTPSRSEVYLIAFGVNSGSATCAVQVYKQDASYPVGLTKCTINSDGSTGVPLLALYTYALTELNELQYVQSGDVAIFTHSSSRMEPLTFVRSASTTFEFQTYDRTYPYVQELSSTMRRMPFRPRNVNTTYVLTTTGAGATTRTLTASGTGFAPFTSSWVGTWVRISDGSTELVGYISAYTSTTVVTLELDPLLSGAANLGDYRWAWGSWSTLNGWPSTVTIYQERLLFGGTLTQPNTIWASATGNLFLILNYRLVQDAAGDVSQLHYPGPSSDSDAFAIDVGSDLSSKLTFLVSDRYVKAGTTAAEHVISPVNGVFAGNGSTQQAAQTFFGSKAVAPAKLSNELIFVTGDGKSLEEVTFSEENSQSTERELTVLADHLVYHGRSTTTQSSSASEFKKLVYQKGRRLIWVSTSNGQLVGIVHNRSGDVLAWFKVELGGTTKTVEGIASLPSPDGGATDALYMVVKRTINGATKKYIERIGEDFEQDSLYGEYTSNQRDIALFTDSCIIAGSATIGGGETVIAVAHLIGETVKVTHEGILVGSYVVDGSGNITIPSELANFVASKSTVIGLPYTSTLRTMPLEAGSRLGNSTSGIKRVDRVAVRLYRTMGGSYSNEEGTSYDLEITEDTDLYSGVLKLDWPENPDTDAYITIESDDPYPMTVLSLTMRGNLEE